MRWPASCAVSANVALQRTNADQASDRRVREWTCGRLPARTPYDRRMHTLPGTTSTQSYTVQLMGQEQGPYSFADIQMMVRSGTIRHDTLLKAAISGPAQWFQAKDAPGLFSPREWMVAALLSVFVGVLGVDRFYVGHIGLGVLKLVTLGGFGIWAFIDAILFILRKVNDKDGLPLR